MSLPESYHEWSTQLDSTSIHGIWVSNHTQKVHSGEKVPSNKTMSSVEER